MRLGTRQIDDVVRSDGKIETKGAVRVLFENVGTTDCHIGIWGQDNLIKPIPKKPEESPAYARGTEALEGTEMLIDDHEVKFTGGEGSLVVTLFYKVEIKDSDVPNELMP